MNTRKGTSGPFAKPELDYQAVCRSSEDGHAFEFLYAYNAQGDRIDDESLWLVTNLSDDGTRVNMHWLTFGDYKRYAKGDAEPFWVFSSKALKARQLRKLLRDPRARLAGDAEIRQTDPAGASPGWVSAGDAAHGYENKKGH